MKIASLLLLVFIALPNAFIGATALSASTPIHHVPRSIVQTHSVYPGEEKYMSCTGFVIDATRGLAITAEHCSVDDEVRFLVDGKDTSIVKKSKWLVLFKVPPMSKPPLTIAKSRSDLGERTWGFGWAFGKAFLQLQRAVAAYDGTDLVVDGAFIEGMSGGPVVNDRGEVVGVIQGGVPGAAWLSGVDEIREFLKE